MLGTQLADGIFEVDFIQSTGTQYIDTMYVPTQTTTCDIEFQFTGPSTFVGEAWAISVWETDKKFRCGLYQKNFYTPGGYVYSENDVNEKTTAHGVCTVDSTISLFICSQHREPEKDTFTANSKFRIYSCVIYDDGNAVRDFVPCYNREFEEFGLYDTVEEKFYGSSGTEKFYGKSFLEEGETYKIFDYEQYFVDREMSNSIANTTITGSGVIDDPYIINSSEDFWWASKYLYWGNIYVELGCDVVLNDEKFDENGNAFGGDGIVYNWKMISTSNLIFDGKNHQITGLYCQTVTERAGLFSWAKSISNLIMANSYVLSSENTAATVVFSVEELKNVQLSSGFVVSQSSSISSTAGMANNASQTLENCVNMASVNSAAGSVGGIAGNANCKVYKCTNYGSISGNSGIGGIFGYGSNAKVSCCKNYGEISVVKYHAGGICGLSVNGGTFSSCENYGSCGSNNSAGITSYINDNTLITGCKNFASMNASMVGMIASSGKTKNNPVTLTIINCFSDGPVSRIYNEPQGGTKDNTKVIIDGYCANINHAERNQQDVLIPGNASILVRNMRIDYEDDVFDLNVCKSWAKCEISIDGLYIKAKSMTKSVNTVLSKSDSCEVKENNIVVEIYMNSSVEKWYYGTDFSGFYVSWKTGQIGLVALDNIGSFANRLNVENLQQMGFVNKSV